MFSSSDSSDRVFAVKRFSEMTNLEILEEILKGDARLSPDLLKRFQRVRDQQGCKI